MTKIQMMTMTRVTKQKPLRQEAKTMTVQMRTQENRRKRHLDATVTLMPIQIPPMTGAEPTGEGSKSEELGVTETEKDVTEIMVPPGKMRTVNTENV